MTRFLTFATTCLAVLVGSSGPARAQTPGQIPMFVDTSGSLGDSVIAQGPAGNIGIGAPSPLPAVKLRVSDPDGRIGIRVGGPSTSDSAAGDFALETSDGLSVGGVNVWAASFRTDTFGAGAPGSLVFYYDSPLAASTFLMGLKPNQDVVVAGNLGIGTTSPLAKLHVIGDFVATGTKSALVDTASYGRRQLYAVESPGNWFEDFGKAELMDGKATVKLDPIFAETVNTESDYHVFLTPKGDCQGLYVASETATSFEVRELKSGKATVAFDYRIIAKRKGYEMARLGQETYTKDSKLSNTK